MIVSPRKASPLVPLARRDRLAGKVVIEEVARRLGVASFSPSSWTSQDPSADWRSWLVAAAKDVGLNATFVDLTARRALDHAEAHGPLVAFCEHAKDWVVLLGRTGSRAQILTESNVEHHATCSIDELNARLGAREADAPIRFAVLEPKLPLDALRAEPGSLPPHRRVFRLLREERADLKTVVLYAVATGALTLAVPIAVQSLVNTIAFGTLMQPVIVLTVVVVAALLFGGALSVLQASVVERLQQRIFVKAAVDVAERLTRVNLDVLRHTYAPEFVNRFLDVVTVQKAAAALSLDGVGLILQTAVGLVLLAFYHPLLLAFDVVLLVAIGTILFVLGGGAVETAVKESKAKYAVVSWLEEIGRNSAVFRSVTTRAYALGRVDRLAASYVGYRRKHWSIFVRQLIGFRVLHALASAALLGVGGYLVIERQLTLGQLVASELIVTSVLHGLTKFGKHLESFYDLAAAADKLGQIIDLPLEEGGKETDARSRSGSRLSVRHERGTLEIPSGARVALQGTDEVAKTDLLEAMYGHATPTVTVTADGVDLRQMDLDVYRSHVQMVRGDHIFEGTLEDNLRVGRDEVPEAQVFGALARVGLLDDVLRLPAGIQTRLLADGAPLTPSQRAQLVFARALLAEPRIMLVDHALDGLDGGVRSKVLELLTAREAPWTLVIATHRDEVARRCSDHRFAPARPSDGVLRDMEGASG